MGCRLKTGGGGGSPLAVDWFVEDGVDDVVVEGHRLLDEGCCRASEVAEDGEVVGAAEDEVCEGGLGLRESTGWRRLTMHHVDAAVEAEVDAELHESSRRQAPLTRKPDGAIPELPQELHDVLHPRHVLGILPVVRVIPLGQLLERLRVHGIRLAHQRRQATEIERLPQPLWIKGQVRRDAETAKALARDAPLPLLLGPALRQRQPHSLRILHNRVRPERLQIVDLRLLVAAQAQRARGDRGAEARAALVEHQELVAAVQDLVGPGDVLGGAAAEARAALQEEQPGQLLFGVVLDGSGVGGLLGFAGGAGEEADGP